MVGVYPQGVFVDRDNTIYIPCKNLHQVKVWTAGGETMVRVIRQGLSAPISIFATMDGSIFVANSGYRRVDLWTADANSSSIVLHAQEGCDGLFVDRNESVYCSLRAMHVVVRARKEYVERIVVAGNGVRGSAPDMLNAPSGIFVDLELTLYVADCSNHRVQRFALGEENGTTVVGSGSVHTILLNCPVDVVLDADGYLFVTEEKTHRIIAEGPTGWRCVAACSGVRSSQPNQLNVPRKSSFDPDGALYVADFYNHRIQKFALSESKSCGQCQL